VWESIKACIDRGFTVKVNCVVLRGRNDDEVADFVRLAAEYPIEVRFLEFMPFSANSWSEDRMVPVEEIFAKIREAAPDLRPVPAPSSSTARLFDAPGWSGRVGTISSMTDAFCGGCNRIRLTSDGMVKNCLFGEDEFPLREALRQGASDDELAARLREAVSAKHFAHGGHADMHALNARAEEGKNRPMIRIGG